MPCFRIVKPDAVLYVDAEDARHAKRKIGQHEDIEYYEIVTADRCQPNTNK
jgi:hypothetical protein